LSPEVELAMRRGGLDFGNDGSMVIETDIDHALERVEETLLCERPELHAGRDLVNHLTAALGPHPRMRDFVNAMSLLSLQPEDVLIKAGEDADDVYFVADGRVRVQLTLPTGRTLRLRTMTGGAIVGEIALYRHQKRTADVIVETPSEIFRLSATDLARLEREDSELAILAHRLLATNLAEKLSVTNRMIQHLHR
jgi:SulP family sulfate permease